MAILRPFECTIEINGVAVQEYEDEEAEQANTTTVLTKYIEVVSGANFSIVSTIQPGWTMHADCAAFELFLDDKWVAGWMFPKESYDGSQAATTRKCGAISGSGGDVLERKFKFADIAIGDECDGVEAEELKKKYGGLGNISVEVWRTKLLRQKNDPLNKSYDELGIVPEKALKGQALSVSTGLSPAERIQSRPKIWQGQKIEPFPVATFRFKYRTREALKQLLVIPRSPSPVPLEERDPQDLTPEEARELVRRQKARLAEMEAVKQEKTSGKRYRSSTIGPIRPTKAVRAASGHSNLELDDSSDDAQIVKVESCSARKSNPFAEIEVIDLLD